MNAKEIWERALKGSSWMAEHQNPDGGWVEMPDAPVDAMYKAAWAFLLTGRPAAAQRNLNFVHQHLLKDDGDFLPRLDAWHTDIHYLYANAYFIIGSVLSGRYEIAEPAKSFLLSQQDMFSGGFYSSRTAGSDRNRIDTMSVSAAGLACIAGGDIQAAVRAAHFLQHLVDLQPDPRERFYTSVEADGSLSTDPKDDAEARWKIVETRTENQIWYTVGLPFAFLIHLHLASRNRGFFDLAQWYFDFQKRCVDPWDGGSSGKAGWGCAVLYRITGEPQYRDIALHVAKLFTDKQLSDGSWVPGMPEDAPENRTLSYFDFDITAEFTLWLTLIASNIESRDRN